MLLLSLYWGYSSVGRAPALQAGGRRFDPGYLHQYDLKTSRTGTEPDTGLFHAGAVPLPVLQGKHDSRGGRMCSSV